MNSCTKTLSILAITFLISKMILILLILIVAAASQANCPDKIEKGSIGCIVNNITNITNISVSINNNIIYIVFAIIVSYRDCIKSNLTLSQIFLKNLNEIFDL